METGEARRFIIIPFEIVRSGQIVQIDHKLPAHFTQCNGVLVSIKGFLDTGREIQNIGELSLLLNSGQVHPIQTTVGYSTSPLKKENSFMPLEEPLMPNKRLKGFYEDAGTSKDIRGLFLPYCLNIYLKCKALV